MKQNEIDILESLWQESIGETFNQTENSFIETMYEEIKEEMEENKETFLSQIRKWFNFTIRYIFSSAVIFVFLLVFSNYSAYFNIVKSYVMKEEFSKKEELLINSVEASNIIEKEQEKKVEEKEEEERNLVSHYRHNIKNLAGDKEIDDYTLDIQMTPYESRIIIPKISKNIPLLDIENQTVSWQDELNDIFMKELEKWVIRYPWSSKPWKEGTTFVFWHSSNFPWMNGDYNDVFALLDKVVFDDVVIVYYNQKKYTYKIREKKVITPWQVDVIKRNKGKNEITLMTCWPVGTTLNRLIVVGELVDES